MQRTYPLFVISYLLCGFFVGSWAAFNHYGFLAKCTLIAVYPSIALYAFGRPIRWQLRSGIRLRYLFAMSFSVIFSIIVCFSVYYSIVGIFHDGQLTSDMSSCFYFSVVTYTTVGYGDMQPSEASRMAAAIEAILGLISIGIIMGITSMALQRVARTIDAQRARRMLEKHARSK